MVDPTFANLSTPILALLIILAIWELIWKGIALWKASKNNHKVWFVIMLIINTAGILPILYIYVFSKKNKKKSK